MTKMYLNAQSIILLTVLCVTGALGLMGGNRRLSVPRAKVLFNSKSQVPVPAPPPAQQKVRSELGAMLDKLPLEEKYAMMIQSYATGILDKKIRGDGSTMDSIESLYIEMLSSSVRPTQQTSQNLIDAASTFCNSAKLGRALQLGRASGNIKAFGAATGQLTTPITSATVASTLYVASPKLPTDDRESEIFCAALAGITGFTYLALQVLSVFDSDLHPWTTLVGVAALAIGGADVALTQGKNLKQAAAGFERLSLRDKERDAYTESSAFLVGYLLGLPCFCFQPDVSEALKLLRTCPGALDVYKQPVAMMAKARGGSGSSSGSSIFGDILGGIGITGLKSNKAALATRGSNLDSQDKAEANARLLKQFINVDDSARADLLGLSRLLVWLVAPVAAETLKYGRSVVSDPRRGARMLAILENLQEAVRKDKAETGAENLEGIAIPTSREDKDALVLWAYNEAVTLIRQYGELLENVTDYICTGTASVGECALLIESELR